MAGGLVAAAGVDGALWWSDAGVFDRASADGPVAVAQRWLAGGVGGAAARALAAAPEATLRPAERVLVVLEGGQAQDRDLAPGTMAAARALAVTAP